LGRDRAHALDPNLRLLRGARSATLDIVGHGNTLDHSPLQRSATGRCVLNQAFPLRDGGPRPDLARSVLMQRADDLGRAGLTDMIQGYRIVRAVPAPSLPHQPSPSDTYGILFISARLFRRVDWSGHLIA